jgi:hypothetical protein
MYLKIYSYLDKVESINMNWREYMLLLWSSKLKGAIFTVQSNLWLIVSHSLVMARIAKPSLPCDRRKTHGNAQAYGKELTKRTAKTCNTANDRKTHGKE